MEKLNLYKYRKLPIEEEQKKGYPKHTEENQYVAKSLPTGNWKCKDKFPNEKDWLSEKETRPSCLQETHFSKDTHRQSRRMGRFSLQIETKSKQE